MQRSFMYVQHKHLADTQQNRAPGIVTHMMITKTYVRGPRLTNA